MSQGEGSDQVSHTLRARGGGEMRTPADVAVWCALAATPVWLRDAPLPRVQGRRQERVTQTRLSQGTLLSGGRSGWVNMNLSKSLWVCFLKIRNRFEFYLAFTCCFEFKTSVPYLVIQPAQPRTFADTEKPLSGPGARLRCGNGEGEPGSPP